MKKLVILILTSSLAWSVIAQTPFTIPDRTALQQHQRVTWILHYNLNVAISYVKSTGKTVEEFGMYCGDQYKLTWPKDGGFQIFVNGIILNLVDISEKVEIISQSDKKVVLSVINLYKTLKEKGSSYNVTYEEYIRFFEASHIQIAERMGCTFSIKVLENEVEVILSKT